MIPEIYTDELQGWMRSLSERIAREQPAGLHQSLRVNREQLHGHLERYVARLGTNYPFHAPFYAGQMLKPPHPAAWLAYALAMTVNGNNHALDGGPDTSFMEKEVVARLIAFTGFEAGSLGHLTSSGTLANLEALWVARELHPDRPTAYSASSHYTHGRMLHLLRHQGVVIPDNGQGEPDYEALRTMDPLPGTVVVTMGTTGAGRVEPLHRLISWARESGVRVHLDAAYGGFFHLLRHSGLIDPQPWLVLGQADSIAMDPHKHGLQPYGCGSILFRDPGVGRFYKHDSPYTYFTSDELHLGEISLECSRSGSAAAALWFTLELLGLEPYDPADVEQAGGAAGEATDPGMAAQTGREASDPGAAGRTKGEVSDPGMAAQTGEPFADAPGPSLAGGLAACRRAALRLYDGLKAGNCYIPAMKPELDIVVMAPVTPQESFSSVSARSRAIMQEGMRAEVGEQLYVSVLEMSEAEARRCFPQLDADAASLTVLRMVLMKPEHLDFADELLRRLERLHRTTG